MNTGDAIAIAVLAALAVALALSPALPAPPPGADPESPMARWFRGAHSRTGAWCCDIADGQTVQARGSDDAWEIWDGSEWKPVPPDTIVDGYPPHPAGSAVAWFTHDGRIRCFSRPVSGG